MGLLRKLGARLLDGAVVVAAVAIAWKVQQQSAFVAETEPSGATAKRKRPAMTGVWPRRVSWRWWWDACVDTYEAMSKDRLLAVAAGVVFYALLAIVPAVTAFVLFYGLFAQPRTVEYHLLLLANVMPAGSIAILREQIVRLTAEPGGLSLGFI